MHNDFNMILEMRLVLSRAQGFFQGLAKGYGNGTPISDLCQQHADEIEAVLKKHFEKAS